MFCPKCGKKNDNNSKFCARCGNGFPELNNVDTNISTTPTNSSTKKKKSVLAILMVIGIIFIISSGIIAFFAFNDSDNHKSESKKKTNNKETQVISNSKPDTKYEATDSDYYDDNQYDSSDSNYYDDNQYDSLDSDYYDNNQYDSNDDYTYVSQNDFYSEIFGVAFTHTYSDVVDWANEDGYTVEYVENSNILCCYKQDPLNTVLDNALNAAGDAILEEHEFGIGDIKNIYEGMTDESNEGFFDSIVGGVSGYLAGIAEEKFDNAVDSAVEDAYNTAISDTNIYYMFILDSKNQVSEYIIQQLYNNRESLCDDYIKKFGQPSINNNVYCWNGQVNGTPAQFYLWIDTDEYNNYVWNIYVKKAN